MNEREILESLLSESRLARLERVLARRTRELTVVLDSFNKPHNYMAVLRTVESFGLQDVHIVPLPGDDTESISKSVTQGAHKWLDLHVHTDWRAGYRRLKERGYRLLGAYLSKDAKPMESHDLSGKTALVMGNELEGLSEEKAAFCDGLYTLPMAGFSQSFNVSVAAALSIQRFFLERERRKKPCTGLSTEERELLRADWLRKSTPHARRILEEMRRREEAED